VSSRHTFLSTPERGILKSGLGSDCASAAEGGSSAESLRGLLTSPMLGTGGCLSLTPPSCAPSACSCFALDKRVDGAWLLGAELRRLPRRPREVSPHLDERAGRPLHVHSHDTGTMELLRSPPKVS
jgi:hypothetical protein